ncbi:MAG TPA: hypothetical protein VND22_00060 [Actinomycetota bacterium]|nr:hypothetical protein [Actinomycetota bacterium]
MRATTLYLIVLVGLLVVALVTTFIVSTRAAKSYDKAKARRQARGPELRCSTCQSTMDFSGVQEFQVAGASGEDSKLGVSAGKLPLEVYRCPTCRKVETFLPPSAG